MMHLLATVVLFAALGLMAAAVDVDQHFRDRYQRLADQADTGLGAEEYRGPRRFTRPTDTTKAPVSPAKKTTDANDQNNQKENQSHAV